jgi:prefoldin subunit 5
MGMNILPFSGAPPPGHNLPPCRAQVARSNADIESTTAEIERLRRGEEQILAELSKVEAGRRDLEKFVKADAANLVARVRGGFDWALSQIAGSKAHAAAQRLAGSAVETATAEEALAEIRAEIERLEGRLASLTERKRELVLHAVREAASGLFEDYETILCELGSHIAILRGLERYLGVHRVSRTVGIVPSFSRANGLEEQPVVCPSRESLAAQDVWRKLAEAIDLDPSAPIDGLLEFPRFEGTEDPLLPYEDRSSLERKIIDMNFTPAS